MGGSASGTMQHEMLTPRHDMEQVDEEAEDMGGNAAGQIPVEGELIGQEDQEEAEVEANAGADQEATRGDAEGDDQPAEWEEYSAISPARPSWRAPLGHYFKDVRWETQTFRTRQQTARQLELIHLAHERWAQL